MLPSHLTSPWTDEQKIELLFRIQRITHWMLSGGRRSQELDDISQEVWLKLARRAQESSSWDPVPFIAIKHMVIDEIRRETRATRPQQLDEALDSAPPLAHDRRLDLIHEALATVKLTPLEGRVLYHVIFKDQSMKVAGKNLTLTPTSVQREYNSAISKLRFIAEGLLREEEDGNTS